MPDFDADTPCENSQDPFLPGERYHEPGVNHGALKGLTFAVKDNIDLCGVVTGAGNPHWVATHDAAAEHAPIITQLLGAGASILGKTVTEELAYSLIGDNPYFGIPLNPAAPDRFPGGSSSGSASAVASGKVDFALGTDTAGSVRIPASNCGIFGIRPTHDSLLMDGVVPLAPSFDVLGWFARSADILARVGKVLFGPKSQVRDLGGLYIFEPAFAALPPSSRNLYVSALDRLDGRICGTLGEGIEWPHNPEFATAHRLLQSREAWDEHSMWVERAPQGAISADVLSRFQSGRSIEEADLKKARMVRDRLKEELSRLLADNGAIIVPTTPLPPLKIGAGQAQRDEYRMQVLRWTCLSSLTGFPEVSMPCVAADGVRLGLSLIGPPKCEMAMISLVQELAQVE